MDRRKEKHSASIRRYSVQCVGESLQQVEGRWNGFEHVCTCVAVVRSGFGFLPLSCRICLVCDMLTVHASIPVFSDVEDPFLTAQYSGAILGANKWEKQFCSEIQGIVT